MVGQGPAHLDEAEDAEGQRRDGRLLHSGESQQLEQFIHPLGLLLGRWEQRAGIEHVHAPEAPWGDPGAMREHQMFARVSPMKSSGCWKVRANPFLAHARHDALVTSSPRRCAPPGVGRRSRRTARSVGFSSAPFGPTKSGDAPDLTSEPLQQPGHEDPSETHGDLTRRQGDITCAGRCAHRARLGCRCRHHEMCSATHIVATCPTLLPGWEAQRCRLAPSCGGRGIAEAPVEAGDSARPGPRRGTWPPTLHRARTAQESHWRSSGRWLQVTSGREQ